jgi:hypothetical protein
MTATVTNISPASVTVDNSTTPPAVTVTLGLQGPAGPQGETGTFDGAEIDGGFAASVYTSDQEIDGGTAED